LLSADSDLIQKYGGHSADSRPMREPSVIGDDGCLLQFGGEDKAGKAQQ